MNKVIFLLSLFSLYGLIADENDRDELILMDNTILQYSDILSCRVESYKKIDVDSAIVQYELVVFPYFVLWSESNLKDYALEPETLVCSFAYSDNAYSTYSAKEFVNESLTSEDTVLLFLSGNQGFYMAKPISSNDQSLFQFMSDKIEGLIHDPWSVRFHFTPFLSDLIIGDNDEYVQKCAEGLMAGQSFDQNIELWISVGPNSETVFSYECYRRNEKIKDDISEKNMKQLQELIESMRSIEFSTPRRLNRPIVITYHVEL